MPWSSFKRDSISPVIAFSCGSDVAEQMTKKSVKVERLRRSRTTMSSAFLFEASSAQALARFSAVILCSPGKDFRGELCFPPPAVRDSEWIVRTQLGFEHPWQKCRSCDEPRRSRVSHSFKCGRGQRNAPFSADRLSYDRCRAGLRCIL